MNKTIAIIKGDGIGPEIVTEAMGILDAVAAKFGHTFTYVDAPMGGNAIDKFGVPLPDSSLATCRNADSVLLGAVGGPKWDNQPAANRPERGLLKLREGMGLYTNVRPAKMFSELSAACPLRADIAARRHRLRRRARAHRRRVLRRAPHGRGERRAEGHRHHGLL